MLQKSKQSFLYLSFIFSFFLSSTLSLANDQAIRATYDQARQLFERRSANHGVFIDQALQLLTQIEDQAEDPDLNYDIHILESRLYYWKGSHQVNNDEKMATHLLGVQKAQKANSIDEGYADAYYFAGINLARWGEAKGIVESLFRKSELESYMKETLSHRTRNDEPGQIIDGYGPDRVFGRLYFKLPGIFGGSLDKSLTHLKKAYSEARSLALNTIYYAETLSSGTREQKAFAKKILDELLAQDPLTFNPSRTPETLEEFELARKLRNELG